MKVFGREKKQTRYLSKLRAKPEEKMVVKKLKSERCHDFYGACGRTPDLAA